MPSGHWNTLTPEQQAAALLYRGPENSDNPNDRGLLLPVKKWEETFSGEQVVLDHIRAARPDLDWFVAPDRVYSINDNPNSCRRVAGYVLKFILAACVGVTIAAMIQTGGN